MNNKIKIECSNIALDVFAQLSLDVPALFLVVYKPSKRKRTVGDVFDTKKSLEITKKKCPARVSPLMTSLGAKKNLNSCIFMTHENLSPLMKSELSP